MKVTINTKRGQAYFHAIDKVENRCSIRFILEDGDHETVKKADIISIEEEKETETMSKYQIESKMDNGEWFSIIYNTENGKYFAGYDFMGSVEWETYHEDAYLMDSAEAYQIVADLESADMPCEPEAAEKRINAGYEVIQSIRLDKTHEMVIAKAVSPSTPAQYVLWDCVNGDDYNTGAYTSTYRQALAAMAERITNRYDSLPVEF